MRFAVRVFEFRFKMPNLCGLCNKQLTRRSEFICCYGCKSGFHVSCTGISDESLSVMRKSRAIRSWLCVTCCSAEVDSEDAFSVAPLATNQPGCNQCAVTEERLQSLRASFESLLNEKLQLLKTQILADMKSMFTDSSRVLSEKLVAANASINTSVGSICSQASYASVVGKRSSVIIKPKNNSQAASVTKAEVLKKINPVAEKISISSSRVARNGGVIVDCINESESKKFKKIADSVLADSYKVEKLRKVLPKIRLINISEKMDAADLVKCIKSQNGGIFTEDSTCEVVSVSSMKKKPNLYQATLAVDHVVYSKVAGGGRLIVGYDFCPVFDAVEVTRCYNCNGFNHTSKNCTGTVVCPRCAENHSVDKCLATVLKCVNCLALSKRVSERVDCEHAAWDRLRCRSFELACSNLRTSVIGVK